MGTKTSVYRYFIFGLILLGTGACSTTSDKYTCENFDWYEIGRRDGASGTTLDRIEKYHNSCHSDFDTSAESMYRNGRNKGLVEYCSGRNGFELGRMRIKYNAVCPKTAESDFMKSYERGETARRLEVENQRLTAQIDEMTEQSNNTASLSDEEKQKLSSDIESLKKQRAENDQEILRISQ